MSENKHTPGPWRYDGHGVNALDGERIAKVQHAQWTDDGRPMPEPRFEADSKLIAAAPDLLECVKKTLPYFVNHPYEQEFYEMCRAAIVKAEGGAE